jgi:hypothetical protein
MLAPIFDGITVQQNRKFNNTQCNFELDKRYGDYHVGEKYKAMAEVLPLFKSECDVNI